MIRSSISLFFPLVVLALLQACGDSTAATGAPAVTYEVETAEVETFRQPEIVFGAGRLAQREETRLSFKTGGVVHRILVREGQTVRAGQVLAELEPEEIEALANQSRLGQEKTAIDLQNARLALQLAERDFRNIEGLYRDSVATLEQLENVETKLKNARNQVQAAETALALQKQQVAVSEYNLDKAVITAPAGGVILRRLAEPNESVAPGSPVLLLGRNDKALVLRVDLADRDIINVHLGDSARVWVDAYPNKPFAGVVRQRASMADPLSGTYEVEVEVLPDRRPLLSGFIGTVEIIGAPRPGLVAIPLDALLDAHGLAGRVFVWAEGKARLREIQIAEIREEMLLVDDGLDPGERVISSGVGYLEENMTVHRSAPVSDSTPPNY